MIIGTDCHLEAVSLPDEILNAGIINFGVRGLALDYLPSWYNPAILPMHYDPNDPICFWVVSEDYGRARRTRCETEREDVTKQCGNCANKRWTGFWCPEHADRFLKECLHCGQPL